MGIKLREDEKRVPSMNSLEIVPQGHIAGGNSTEKNGAENFYKLCCLSEIQEDKKAREQNKHRQNTNFRESECYPSTVFLRAKP